MRPSPTDSATLYAVGHQQRGNDGNMYEVRASATGVQRWVKASHMNNTNKVTTSNFVPISQIVGGFPRVDPKFKVGDKVRIVQGSRGAAPEDIGTEHTITEVGLYLYGPTKCVGYKTDNPVGNQFQADRGAIQPEYGFISEQSFELIEDPIVVDEIIDPNAKQIFKLNPKMSKVKTITKRSTQEVRQIETSLINKEEVFKMLALAESTGLPLLLVGNPGVAKTKTVIEYAKAWLNRDQNMTAADFANKIYILETDEGTKASEIKGMPDLGKLFTDNKYEVAAPIAEAEIVVINEVDKASSAIRNAMLGVMNEKFLFNGKHKIPCKWKLFVATCNEIPKEEVGSPFWDRFMLKHTVNRVSAGEIMKYYEKGARDYKEKFSIGIPNKQEIHDVEIPVKKLEKYLEVGHTASSDRTLTFVPSLAKAVSYIWDISVDKALVKTAQIMINQSAGSELQNKLMSPEVKAVMSKVEMLHSYQTNEQLELAIAEIEGLINTYATRGVMDSGQVTEIETSMGYILQNHPARKDFETTEEFESVMQEADVDGGAMPASLPF